jgi:hypothetical protein
LVQRAWAAARKKASHLQVQFHRPRARRGQSAVAASILTAAHHLFEKRKPPHDLGPDHFDKQAEDAAA